MKEITCCLLLLLLSSFAIGQSQNPLQGIEEQIHQAQDQSFAEQADKLAPLLGKLEAMEPSEWLDYWKAYAAYQGAIYLMVIENQKGALAYLDQGLALLEPIDKPSDEEYALLGSLYSLSITFKPGEAIGLSAKARKSFNKALKKNSDNLRALLGIGRSDYYKPKQYGGGKEAEAFLLKALAAPDQYSSHPNAPTWGRDDAYYYLAAFYQREDRRDDAKLYCHKGLKEFPTHHLLAELLAKL